MRLPVVLDRNGPSFGIGTLVAELPPARSGDRKRLLQQEVEQLVVEAKRLGLGVAELQQRPFRFAWGCFYKVQAAAARPNPKNSIVLFPSHLILNDGPGWVGCRAVTERRPKKPVERPSQNLKT